MHPSVQGHAQCHFTALNLLCSACSLLPLLSLLGTTDIFTVPVVLPFPERPRVGITQKVACSDWLLSLRDMHLSFLPVFSWFNNSFLFNAGY